MRAEARQGTVDKYFLALYRRRQRPDAPRQSCGNGRQVGTARGRDPLQTHCGYFRLHGPVSGGADADFGRPAQGGATEVVVHRLQARGKPNQFGELAFS